MSTAQKKAAPAAAKPKAAPAPATKKAAVPREPAIDLAALVAQDGIARPASSRGGKSAWVPVLMKLEPNQSYFIEGKTTSDLGYVKKIAKREGINISLYTVHEKQEDGEVLEGVRLFRDPDADAPEAAEEETDDDGLGEE